MSKTVSVRLDEDILKKLDMMAKSADRSRAWLMSQAVRQYVEHESWQIEAIRKSLEKLESGQAQFADHGDVARWLNSWGSTDETGCPSCK